MMPRTEPDAPPRRGRPCAWSLLPVAGGAALAGVVSRWPILTPDVWWHLATGRVIATAGIPSTDPFSWRLGGTPWIVHEWLSELVLHGAERAGGLLGVVALRAALLVLAALLSYRLARLHAGRVAALAVVAAAVWASQRNWLDRPQLWSFALAPALVLLLEQARRGRRRLAWAVPVLLLAWVNLHGGFALGLGLCVAWGLASAVDGWRGDAAAARHARALALPVAASFLATLVNPNGLAGALYPLRYVGSGLAATIQEEQVGQLDSPYAWVHFGLALALAVTLVAGRVRREGTPLAHVALGLALAWLSMPRLAGISLPFAAERHAPIFLFAATPLLAWGLARTVGERGRALGASLESVGRALPTWLAAAAVTAFVLWRSAATWPRDPSPAARLLPGRFPTAAADWLAGQPLPQRLLNPYRWGGYLAYRLAPRYRVWIDSRGDLYGADRLAEEEILYRMPRDAESAAAALLVRDDPDVVVWYLLTLDFGRLQVHPFTRWLLGRPDWRLVWFDGPDPHDPRAPWAVSAVFLRVHERNAALLEALPAVQPPPGLPL